MTLDAAGHRWIARVLWIGLGIGGAPAWAQQPTDATSGADDTPGEDSASDTEEAEAEADSIQRYRTPFPILTERVIGTASRPVEFDWRRTRIHVGATGAELFELNNFDSFRAGAIVRLPADNLLYEFGLGWAWVNDTPSSRQLALTPYRQPGRPPRLAVDFNVGIPLAEGVVTTAPRWFPAVELVFSGYAGLRYAAYPGATEALRLRDKVAAVIAPGLSPAERQNLDDARLDAMRIDPARYTTMLGFGNDVYFRQGVFVNPRAS
ncbi:MAG: hypothetical protein VX000_15975, partial [Myxococcota bacterium]|nr:hypothetical protein [Myxococcota bacterium]